MKTLLSVLAIVVALLVVAWVAIFGGLGALIGSRRGRTSGRGFLIGTFFGPFGWIYLLVRPGTGRQLTETLRERATPNTGDGPATTSAGEVSDDDDLPIR